MTTKLVTIKEATERLVNEFNAIPQSLIQKAYPNMEGLEILCTDLECGNCGNSLKNDDEYCTNCDQPTEDNKQEKYDLPMWGTMWTVSNFDSEWIRNNLETVRDCGIWVYESDELDILIGIDGAGYDFYESHWIPFYNARGLQWHTVTDNE